MMSSSNNLSANMCFLRHICLQPHVLPSFRGQSDTVFHWQYLSVSHVTISDCSYGHSDYTAGYNSPDIPKMLEGKDKDRHKPAVALKFLVEMFLLKSFKISNAQSRIVLLFPSLQTAKLKICQKVFQTTFHSIIHSFVLDCHGAIYKYTDKQCCNI